jgi:hypothetical protein
MCGSMVYKKEHHHHALLVNDILYSRYEYRQRWTTHQFHFGYELGKKTSYPFFKFHLRRLISFFRETFQIFPCLLGQLRTYIFFVFNLSKDFPLARQSKITIQYMSTYLMIFMNKRLYNILGGERNNKKKE